MDCHREPDRSLAKVVLPRASNPDHSTILFRGTGNESHLSLAEGSAKTPPDKNGKTRAPLGLESLSGTGQMERPVENFPGDCRSNGNAMGLVEEANKLIDLLTTEQLRLSRMAWSIEQILQRRRFASIGASGIQHRIISSVSEIDKELVKELDRIRAALW